MAIIQRPRRITSESVSDEAKESVNFVGSSVNTFMEEIYLAIMGKLSPGDNINSEYKTLNVNVDSDGTPNTITSYRSGIQGKVKGMQVIRVFGTFPDGGTPFVSFVENGGIINVVNVQGLAADTDYQLVLLIHGS